MKAPPLHHGAIGNGRVLALIAPTSAVEWLCLPRFDSPSLFGRILDDEQGGTFRILGPDRRELTGKMAYLPNTNVLVTKFEDGDAAWEVIDFAPRIMQGRSVDVPIELLRIVRPVRGLPRVTFDLDPRPDYGRQPRRLCPADGGLAIEGAGGPLTVYSNLARDHLAGGREVPLREPVHVVITWGRRTSQPTTAEVRYLLDETVLGWRAWAKSCALPNFVPDQVLRSALCLKLHAYHDTGAIIAAATTSIPEAMDSPRTWDYRYCWLRDAAFVVEALRRLSHLNEGEHFIRFLRDVADAGPLQPLYGITGERDLPEVMLPHLRGFGGNGHVRIGNAAAIQTQHDLMGELVLCLETVLTDPRLVVDDRDHFWELIERMVEEAIRLAPVPDMGIVSRWNKDALHARFGAVGPREVPADDPTRRAAVAVVLRLGDVPHVLLMKRIEREGDPWSGQVSFPGGRFQVGDPDLRHTAIRETHEELGIDLAATATYVGALEPIAATGRVTGRPLPATSVTPFLFLEQTAALPVLGAEAEAAFWLPIERAAGGIYDGEMQYVHQGTPMTFPCWRFDGYVIWGLTYRMLRSLIEALATPASPAP